MNRTPVFLAAFLVAGMPSAAQAQPPSTPITITLRPAGEPVPALKYRLVPERRALVPGNAAIFYHRGIQFVIQRRAQLTAQDKEAGKAGAESAEQEISEWVSGPIAKIPRDEARKHLATFENALKEAELGARRSTCDWEFDQRTEGIYLLLPDIQEMRSLARLVALRAKLAILDGKTDDAMHWIETGLVMGRHVGQGPILIQSLVGIAIDSVMVRCLEDLIQAPGVPSLYWALADRPRPFIDMRYALEGERYMLEKELPELDELGRGVWSVDQARRFVDELEHKLFALVGGGSDRKDNNGGGMPDLARRLGVAAMASKIYPEAKRALIARGRPEAEVEAMPIVQVAAIFTLQEYQRSRDNAYKWMNMPYWQSCNGGDRTLPMTVEKKLANPLLTLFQMLDPALNAARMAFLRLDRQLDALECVEAIRLHAAAHGGKLPASLEEITDAPPPIDPATGKPFGYKVDGDSATLTAPVPRNAPNHPSYRINYLLKLAR